MQNTKNGLTRKILLAMGMGIACGLGLFYLLPYLSDTSTATHEFFEQFILQGVFDIVGKAFIASLKVLVVPLVFVSLVCGVGSIKDTAKIGAISIKTLALYCLTTAMAITLALLVADFVGPGVGVSDIQSTPIELRESPGLKSVILNIFPVNIFNAMATGNMLQVIVFAILLGVAISHAGEDGVFVMRFFNALDKVIMKLVLIVMNLAPYGVFCLMALMFATTGPDHIEQLSKYFLTVLGVLLLHGLGVLGGLFALLTRLNPITLFKKVKSIWLFAFSTASSNATIPVTLSVVENKLGVNNKVAAFTVPLGATINMDGTAIMQGVATVFIAQVYGIEIGLLGYLTVIVTATLASIGTAGVPGVGLITLAMVLGQVGLPVEGIALIIGIDRLLDMIRTAVNVTGDAIVSVIVARSSGDLDEVIYTRSE